MREFQRTLATHVTTVQQASSVERSHGGTPLALVTPSIDRSLPSSNSDLLGFEGASSIHAHTRWANDFVEKALLDDVTGHLHLDRAGALAALKQLSITKAPTAITTSAADRSNGNLVSRSKLELPPFSAVAVLLKAERENPRLSLDTWLTSFVTVDVLTQYCMDVYFAPTCTDSRLIIVNAYLLWLFTRSDVFSLDLQRRYASLCQLALDATISDLPLLIHPDLESVHALVLGALHAVGSAKSSLAWTLLSKAYELCQTLGLHRSGRSQDEDPAVTQHKTSLFWTLYMLEKGLSLRLGRCSSIQESDIEICPDDPTLILDRTAPYVRHMNLSISAARIQASVYEKLYSPHALSLAQDSRQATAHGLVKDIDSLRKELEQSSEVLLKQGQGNEQDYFYSKGDEVALLSVATLVHRAIPAENSHSTFSERCVTTARQALDLHQQCMTAAPRTSDTLVDSYLNWSILYTPFMPLFVVFCNIIETADKTDLSRLQDFVSSIQAVSVLSPPAVKLSQLAQVLHNIAYRFVELHSVTTVHGPSHAQRSSNAGLEVDEYLDALGLAPARRTSMAVTAVPLPSYPAYSDEAAGDFFQADPSQLNGWLDDHEQMLDLLYDQDLQLLGTNYFRGVANV
ncbi:hypothetical protein LTR49_004010 [Elasticomyces elasticus]|nr:hypothetical protein LTR49_004010 [Elasticomyces elasticus]KAK5764695.1 hypothetical protein LTS12_005196 [Elasticomyces elasticus]